MGKETIEEYIDREREHLMHGTFSFDAMGNDSVVIANFNREKPRLLLNRTVS